MRPAGLLRVVALALIWGSAFLWIKLSLKGFSPVQLTWARLTLGAAVLIAVLALSSRTLPHQAHLWKRLAVAALLGNAIPYLLFGIAEQQVSSSPAGAVNATTPLWTLAIALAVRAQPVPGTLRLIGLVLCFLGTLTILAPWEDLGRGYHVGALLCLAASASYGASYVYVGRFLSNTGLSSVVLSAGQLTGAAGWLTLSLPAGGLTVPVWRADAVTALGILGILGTGAAYVLNYQIIAADSALLASTVTYLLPVVAVVLGFLVLDEPLTLRMTAGVVVVMLSVALTRSTRRIARAEA